MSVSLPVGNVPGVETLEETAHASLLRRLLKNPTGLVSMAFLALVLLVAIFAPWLAPHDPNPPRLWTSWPVRAASTGSGRTAPGTTSSRG